MKISCFVVQQLELLVILSLPPDFFPLAFGLFDAGISAPKAIPCQFPPSSLPPSRIPIPLGWLSPVGYVDTPYLDEDLRISKGDKGSLFIASRGGSA